MPLVMPNGNPNLIDRNNQQQQQQQNPWAQYGLDPTKRQAAGQRGTLQQAQQGLNYYAQQRGKTISEQDWQTMAQKAGYQGGDVTGDHYNKSMDYLDSLWGPQQNGNEQQQDPVKESINQWKEQAPVAGVPQQFKQHPLYGQQVAMMQRILAQPQTMGPDQQRMLNERQKESATRMSQQMQAQGDQALAGRGFGGGGGAQQQFLQQNQQNMMNQILSGRRDVALQAAQQNRQDELNALNASMGFQQQEFGQDMGLSQQALNQMNQNRGANLQELLGKHGMNMDIKNFDQQKDQFNKGFGLDFLRYLQSGDQFNRSLGEQQRQYNGNMGYNWANFDQNAQTNFMNMIMRGWM